MTAAVIIAVGVLVGIITDTENWPVDSWLVVEPIYVTIAVLVVGTIQDVQRWHKER